MVHAGDDHATVHRRVVRDLARRRLERARADAVLVEPLSGAGLHQEVDHAVGGAGVEGFQSAVGAHEGDVADAAEILELAIAESDESLGPAAEADLVSAEKQLADLNKKMVAIQKKGAILKQEVDEEDDEDEDWEDDEDEDEDWEDDDEDEEDDDED